MHSPYEFQRCVDEQAVEVLQALHLADAAGLKTSSHYTDELSAHLLCASKNPVYLAKHAFALDAYLEEPQQIVDGHVRPTEMPGTGMRFDQTALAHYLDQAGNRS